MPVETKGELNYKAEVERLQQENETLKAQLKDGQNALNVAHVRISKLVKLVNTITEMFIQGE